MDLSGTPDDAFTISYILIMSMIDLCAEVMYDGINEQAPLRETAALKRRTIDDFFGKKSGRMDRGA